MQRRNQAKSGLVGWVMGAGVAGMIVVASLVVMFGQADSKRPNDKLPPSTSPVAAKLPEGLRRAMRFSDHGGRNHTFVDVPSLHLQNWPEFTIEAWVTPHSPRYLSVLMSQTHSSGGVALRIDDQERWTAIIHDSQWNSDAVSEPLPVRSGRRQHVALAVDVVVVEANPQDDPQRQREAGARDQEGEPGADRWPPAGPASPYGEDRGLEDQHSQHQIGQVRQRQEAGHR